VKKTFAFGAIPEAAHYVMLTSQDPLENEHDTKVYAKTNNNIKIPDQSFKN
jgi:hypothetical protein